VPFCIVTQSLQAPHLNICRDAIAITVVASLTASLCAGLFLWQHFIHYGLSVSAKGRNLFFSGHKKQGAEAGAAIKQTLAMGISSADDLLSGKPISIPMVAIIDPYVAGFITSLSVISMSYVYKGANWNNKKRTEFLMECWKVVGLSTENCHVYARVMGDPAAEAVWDKDGQYSKGSEAAFLSFGAAYGILNAEDLQSDIIQTAQQKAAQMMGIDKDLGFEAGDNAALGAAVSELTIQKHMKKHYSGSLI